MEKRGSQCASPHPWYARPALPMAAIEHAAGPTASILRPCPLACLRGLALHCRRTLGKTVWITSLRTANVWQGARLVDEPLLGRTARRVRFSAFAPPFRPRACALPHSPSPNLRHTRPAALAQPHPSHDAREEPEATSALSTPLRPDPVLPPPLPFLALAGIIVSVRADLALLR